MAIFPQGYSKCHSCFCSRVSLPLPSLLHGLHRGTLSQLKAHWALVILGSWTLRGLLANPVSRLILHLHSNHHNKYLCMVFYWTALAVLPHKWLLLQGQVSTTKLHVCGSRWQTSPFTTFPRRECPLHPWKRVWWEKGFSAQWVL